MTLDPRSKLALLILGIIVIMLTPVLTVLCAEAALVVVLIVLSHSMRAWLRVLRTAIWLVVFLFVFYLWTLGPEAALSGALRLFASVSAFFLFFQVTEPEDMGNSLAQSGVPYSFVFILITAMQFAPVLARQSRDIFDAQRARGIRLELELGSLKNLPALLAPLLIQAFTMAEQLAEALEARGFGSPQLTLLRQFRFTRLDYVMTFAGLAAAAGIILLVR
ncbi:MAG TPA: energy-coupling factor transporter transmembrane component T [Anaerolineae bacterium]|jgi:energy-coupling factor transport system permease protein